MPAVAKRERVRLVKAELLMYLAVKAQMWGDEIGDRDDRTRPFEEWPDDDPFRQLCTTYGVSGEDLAKVLTGLGDQLERRAERAGYAEAWGGDTDPWSDL